MGLRHHPVGSIWRFASAKMERKWGGNIWKHMKTYGRPSQNVSFFQYYACIQLLNIWLYTCYYNICNYIHIWMTMFICKYGVSCPIDYHPKQDCQCFLKKPSKDCLDGVSGTHSSWSVGTWPFYAPVLGFFFCARYLGTDRKLLPREHTFCRFWFVWYYNIVMYYHRISKLIIFGPNQLWSCPGRCQSRVPTTSGLTTALNSLIFLNNAILGLSSLPNR